MSYHAAIVGCGLIGSEFSNTVTLPGVWSHAAAYAACPDTKLVAVCDQDRAKLNSCVAQWKTASPHNDLTQMLDACQPQIVSICTPDTSHFELVQIALKHSAVMAVLVEKPLAMNLGEANDLIELSGAYKKVLAVNYSRRYAPGFQRLNKIIESGDLGEIQLVSGLYTKGTLHNGTHWFDLALFLFGPVSSVTAVDRLSEAEEDPTLDVVLKFGSGISAYLHACDTSAYSIFEMDIIGSRGRVRIVDSGFTIEYHQVTKSGFGAGYKKLLLHEEINGDLGEALPVAVANLVQCLREGSSPLCSARDARQALEVGFSAMQAAQTGQAVVL